MEAEDKLVGRDVEIGHMLAVIQMILQGKAATMLLTGEAGTGALWRRSRSRQSSTTHPCRRYDCSLFVYRLWALGFSPVNVPLYKGMFIHLESGEPC